MTALLRRMALVGVRWLPARLRSCTAAELEATMRELAAEARRRGGPSGERAYWRRELADLAVLLVRSHRHGRRDLRRALASLPAAIADDWRASVRQARRRPLATAGVVGMVAAAVAAVTTTFGIATAVLWRPLPLPDAGRLVFVWESDGEAADPFRVTSGRFAEWERDTRSFASLALFGAAGFSLDGPDGSQPVRGVRVSAAFFDTLGMRPRLGRGLASEDEAPGRHRVIVISERMWRNRFGSDPGALGRHVRLSGEPYEVIGVMPDLVTPGWPTNPAHVGVEPELREFWVPIPRTPALAANTRAHVFGVVARLRNDVTAAQANAELASMQSAAHAGRHGGVTRAFREQFVGDVRTPLVILLAGALAVLLVAIANLAALQVSRFEGRRGELVTRLALGAGRLRLAGLLTADAAALAALGGGVGLGIAAYALRWIPNQLPASMPLVTAPEVDRATALIACAVAAVVAIGLSLWPVLRLSGVAPSPRGAVVPPRTQVYRLLVAAQVAMAVALAVPASLLGQSLSVLRARDAGFNVDAAIVADVSVPPGASGTLSRVTAFENRVREAVGRIAGVRGVALAYDHPLEANWTDAITLIGDTNADPAEGLQVQLRIVSPSYFEALGVEVVDGRAFEEREDASRPGVVVVNEAFAAGHGGQVIGRRLTSGAAGVWGPAVPHEYAIVGVVENERFRGVDRPSEPAIYLSTRQFPLSDAAVLVRTTGETDRIGRELRSAIRLVEPDATMGTVRPLLAILSEQLTTRRITADVVNSYALAAVGLSVLGLYGLMAMTVASRVRDVGVRLALGATPGRVARAVLVETIQPALVGVGVGVGLALGVGHLVAHLLVDVSPRDPVTIGAVGAGLLLSAVAAAAIPARRAARVDPVVALKVEP